MDVVIPKWGLTMEEAILVRWLVAPGDVVVEGEPLAELEADKIEGELKSPGSGAVAELHGAEGETYPVGAVVARLDRS
jgi:pyruvate/2-oxoglutarate dehydrogenase complex dihydrolipoamide acyltransferase (E2) component